MLTSEQVKVLDNQSNYDPAIQADIKLGSELNKKLEASNFVLLTSSGSAGGGTSETLTINGLRTGDIVRSVTQKTPGSNHTALTGFGTPSSNSLPVSWTGDPGTGAVVVVQVER